MRILIVTQYFWPEEFRINDLALGLRERGHEVTVYTGKPNYPAGSFFPGYGLFRRASEDYHGVRVIRVPLLPRGNGGRMALIANYLSFALLASAFAPFRRIGACDVIFVYEPSPVTIGLPAILMKWIKQAPILFWVQDLWPETLSATGAVHTGWILKLVEHFVRFIYRHSDLVLLQSQAFIPHVRAQGIPDEKLRYYPNSAEALYQPVAVPPDAAERALLPQGFRVMFAGNIGVAQDFETIIDAAERLRKAGDIHWVIIGDGRQLEWLMQEIARRRLGSTVHLLGRHPVESMPRFFALADAMLVTLKNEPIFGLTIPAKLQSYLACGCPIVGALDGEGASVISEAEAGIPVPAGDAAALADAVLKLHGLPLEERKAMGRRGREYFLRNFERSLLLDRLEEWCRDLAQARK